MTRRARNLAVLLALAALAVAGCVLAWQQLLASQARETGAAMVRTEQRATQLAEAATQEIEATLRSVDIGLRHLRQVWLTDQPGFQRAAREMLAVYPPGLLQAVNVFGIDGRLAWSSSPVQQGAFFGDDEYFRAHAVPETDPLFVSAPRLGKLAGEDLVQVTRALHDDGARFVGVLGIPLRPEHLSARLAKLQIDSADLLAVVRMDGSFVARSSGLEEALRSRVPSDRPFLKSEPGERGFFRSTAHGTQVPLVLAWRRLADWPLVVTAAIDEERELGPMRLQHAQARQQAAAALALAWLALAGAVVLVLRIQQKNVAIARSERLHRALFEGSRTPMLLIDPADGALVDANQAAAAYYGHPQTRLRQMNIAELHTRTPQELQVVMAEACAGLRDCFQTVHRLADGALRDVEVRSGPLEIRGRRLLYSIVNDVTDRVAATAAAQAASARLAALLQTASDGIHVLDEHGCLTQYSESFAQMLGYEPGEVLTGLQVSAWDALLSAQAQREILSGATHQARRFETRHRRKDGSLIDVEINSRALEVGGQRLFYAASRDITERKRDEQQLRIAAVAFETQQGIVVTDAHNRILRVNSAFTEITGYASEDVVGQDPRLLQSGRQDRAFYAAMWRSLHERGAWAGEIWNRRKSGEIYPEWLSITAVRAAGGAVTNYVATIIDITGRKAAEDEVRQLAFYDPLTHLPNRRLLLNRLQQALAGSARTGLEGAVLFIDLDDFKTLNDTRGHDVGDRLLMLVAQRLTGCLREGETAARLGGDEFVVMVEDLAPHPMDAARAAEVLCERIVGVLGEPYQVGTQVYHGTASIGVTLFDGRLKAVDDVLKRADLAMYQAKASGRNAVRFFDPEMQAVVTARAALASDLRQALVQQEFQLHYQCLVDSAGQVRGAEALLRWQHPTRGLVSPAEFIPVAEDSALIVPIGQWVLEEACAQLVQWAGHPRTAALTLAVNVSARQFRQADFVDQVKRALVYSGAPARRLKLELTESMLVSNIEDLIAKMGALKAVGVSFALDDFGTGYSSLSYLSRLPLDQLKIDRSFVSRVETDDNSVAICTATISLAHSLNLEVVAEGVETEGQRHFLSQVQRCDYMQGYLFGRPLPLRAFESLVHAGAKPLAAPEHAAPATPV